MAVYVVGDIQGCHHCLLALLDQAGFDPAADRLWSVGDLVNRGPRSLDTLRFLKGLGPCFTMVLGNHDLHLLALASGACRDGNRKTLQQVLDAPDCAQLCAWLRAQPLAHFERLSTGRGGEAFLMTHAGLPPIWTLEQALARAREVEQVLQGPGWLDFLSCMYGDKPDKWDDRLEGPDRLRFITNSFTRLRFCDADGRLDLNIKTSGQDADPTPGFRPWFEFSRADEGYTILFGHWAALDGHTGRADILALDTGCVWGRRLSLLRLEDRRLFQVECSAVPNTPRRSSD